ncbi:MAG TPA: Mu transposase C-terminal domain-containing protein [Acidovorax sp.]|jgi:putative transposase|nr:Mu transposase C-terminal domain-containing protein [Acidovorax sp.]
MPWFTIRELSGLPGFEMTPRAVRDKLIRLSTPGRPRTGREGGGGLEYDTSALPAETRAAITARIVAQAATTALALAQVEPASAPVRSFASPAKPLPDQLVPVPSRRPPSVADKAVADARVQLVNMLHDLVPLHGIKKGCAILAGQIAISEAGSSLVALARASNQRARGDMVSARTLERWASQHRASGWWGLLPVVAEVAPLISLDDDVARVIGLYHSVDARFRKLTRAALQVTKDLGRDRDTWQALYARARRALDKLGQSHEFSVGLIKARHTGSERDAKLPFKKRATEDLDPTDIYVIDGHTFKAKVRHPDHGAPFAPEFTAVLSWGTRKIVGWSVSLSENVTAVGDALRHAISNHGIPAIVYSDNGSGETAKALDCPVVGIMARLGIDHRTGIPGKPQARGVIERSWQTHAINCARQFGSYQGKDVDGGTFRKAAAELAKEQRAVLRAEKTGEVIKLSNKAPTWKQFIDAIEKMVDEYNNEHRHRSLPKRADGKRMTPAEAWEHMADPALRDMPTKGELRDLFMPAMVRTAKRGQVTLLNQDYQAPELMRRDVDGREVSVRYDIHDPNYVLVYTLDGMFVCEALWQANRIDAMPKAAVQIARETRAAATIKRRQQQIDLALRELQAPVDAAPSSSSNPVFLSGPAAPEALPFVEVISPSSPAALASTGEAVQTASDRPFFDTPSDRYEWLMHHQGTWTSEDDAWLATYVASDDYEGLADYYVGRGLDWKKAGSGSSSSDDAPVFKSAL